MGGEGQVQGEGHKGVGLWRGGAMGKDIKEQGVEGWGHGREVKGRGHWRDIKGRGGPWEGQKGPGV